MHTGRGLLQAQQLPGTPACVKARQISCTLRKRHSSVLPLSSNTTSAARSSPINALLTLPELQRLAQARGHDISLKTLGPFYRIVCRQGSSVGSVLAVTSGFVAPAFRLMHCDMLQIFPTKCATSSGANGPLAISLLMGGAVFAHGHACGCDRAEILAINDDESWHQRLVRYYRFFGFVPVEEVGERGLIDLPHLLVWGGVGTRMDADVSKVLKRWTPALRRSCITTNFTITNEVPVHSS